MRVKLDVENRTIVRVVLIMTAIWLGIQLVIQIQHALILILVSFFLAMALNKPVNLVVAKLTKGKGGRGLATGIAYLAVLTVVGGFIYLTVPPLVNGTTDLINEIPAKIEELNDSSNGGTIADFIEKYDLQDEADEVVANATKELSGLVTPVVSGAGKVAAGIISVLTVLVLTFFMLVEGPSWMRRFWEFTPKKQLEHNKKLATQMQGVVTSYVNGQFVIALLAGVSSLVIMLILGLPNAIALAGVVAMFALIPMIGAIMGSLIVILVALSQSFAAALIMLVFFIIYQQVENNTIQPYIQSRALNLSPLIILAAVIVGFSIGGILGGFLAIPTVAAGQILLLDYLDRRKTDEDKKYSSAKKS